METKRLQVGDEQLAIDAAVNLISEEEREGHRPSLPHMHALLAKDENYLIVAAEANQPVGFLIAYRMPKFARDASMVYLYEIGVDEEYRRLGIATQMINLLKALCAKTAVVEIWVGTEKDNIAAKELYKSTGAILDNPDTCEFVYAIVPRAKGNP